MSRSDGSAMRLPCPAPDCRGSLQLDQRDEPAVVKCRVCGFSDTVTAYCSRAFTELQDASARLRAAIRGDR